MKGLEITKQTAELIMQMSRNGEDMRIIAKKVNCSQAFISTFIRAYNGNNEQFMKLAIKHRSVIIDLRKDSQINKSQDIIYECSLLFGLIKLQFKPIKN